MSEDNKTPLSEEQTAKLPELAEVVTLLQDIQGKVRQTSDDREKIEKLTAEVARLSSEFKTVSAPRAGEFSTREAEEILRETKDGPRQVKAIDVMLKEPSNDPQILKIQETVDRAYILSQILKKPVSELGYWRRALQENPVLKAAIGVSDLGNAGVLAALTGWQPAEFSNRMIEKVRMQYVLTGLHPRFNMPADPYRFPLEGGDATAYLVSEQTDQDAEVTDAKKVTVGLSTTGADHLLLQSKKLGARVLLSGEAVEDSFIPIMPYVEGKIARCMAEASENVTMNGDLTSGALDTGHGAYAAGDQRRAWNGYRRILQTTSTAKVSATTPTALDIKDIRAVRQNMGKYGINPSDLTIVCGPIGYVKLLGLNASPATDSPVLTLDKLGPRATILTGQLAEVDGIPIIVSEFVGPVVGGLTNGAEQFNVSGIYDGVTTSYTAIYFIRRSAFLYGDRRQMTLNSRYVPDTDQHVLVTLSRQCFVNLYTGQTVVGGIVGITK